MENIENIEEIEEIEEIKEVEEVEEAVEENKKPKRKAKKDDVDFSVIDENFGFGDPLGSNYNQRVLEAFQKEVNKTKDRSGTLKKFNEYFDKLLKIELPEVVKMNIIKARQELPR
jgi:hypothetical protein